MSGEGPDEASEGPREHLRAWWPGLLLVALATLGLATAGVLASLLAIGGESRDLTMFLVGAVLLPPASAVVIVRTLRPSLDRPCSTAKEAAIAWTAVGVLATCAVAPLAMHLADPERSTLRTVAGVVAAAAAAASVAASLIGRRPHLVDAVTSRRAQAWALLWALAAAIGLLFRVDPADPYLNVFVRLFFDPPFSAEPGALRLPTALLAGAGGTGLALALWNLDAAIERDAQLARRWRRASLGIATVATTLLFFDFSLAHDTFHYLTNVAPALHVLSGGTLMVDAFSQYGPGPVLMTAAGLALGPHTFGPPQLVVQAFNVSFYALWLACLHRMARRRLPAMLLGIFAIALFHAVWARGLGSVNEAPSVLGLRHLPTLLMVWAIARLSAPRRHSWVTSASTFVSGLWSIETAAATLGVHGVFLTLLATRDRAPWRLAVDAARAAAPLALSLAAMSTATLMQAGVLPDFGIYLSFLASYNPYAESWATPISAAFWGWLPVWLAIIVVFGDAWARALEPEMRLTSTDDEGLFYGFVPMGALLMVTAEYFASRSVDYTLAMSVLPCSAIAIPAALHAIDCAWARPRRRWILLALAAAGVWVLAFTSLSLLRERAPYSFLIHECRDHGRCSPSSLFDALGRTMRVRAVLERVDRPMVDGWFDTEGVVRDAMAMMETWARDAAEVTVLLGRLRGELVGSEIALMYAGKWHRWPRSMTFTDQLVPELARRIVSSPVALRPGELVLVRRDESTLGDIESGILQRIRAMATLCPVESESATVSAFRVAGAGGCTTP